jgi:hypothetical protein
VTTPEPIAEFTFFGVTEKIVLRQEAPDRWDWNYCRVNGYPQCHGDAKSRRKALRQIKRFMIGHGQVIMSNLSQSAEERKAVR